MTNVWSPASSNPSAIAALGGDVTGTVGANTVVKLRGRAIAATAPTDGQVYQYVAANSDWEPVTPSAHVVTVPVTSAQIKTLNDTPVVLVPGTAGKITNLVDMTFVYLAGATPYTIAPLTNLSVYTATALTDWLDVPAAGFIDQSTSRAFITTALAGTAEGALTDFAGQDIILQADASPTLGNGTLLVTVSYFLAATA